MQYFFYILSSLFLYINYKIVLSDIQEKKIPNKMLIYLLYLLPFYYLSLYFGDVSINIYLFILQIFITLILSFILYNFGIWSAGDAKYLGVLSLFIPHIGIIPFVGNISLLTIIYLFGYFLYFYCIKNTFNHVYRKSLWVNIHNDLKEKFLHFLKAGDGKYYTKHTLLKITKTLIFFFVIFVTIRLSRIYLLKNIVQNHIQGFTMFEQIATKHSVYVMALFGIVFIGGLYLLRKSIFFLKFFLLKKAENSSRKFPFIINETFIDFFLLGCLGIGLFIFLYFEFLRNKHELWESLYKIFTIYLAIYLFVKGLIYSYKITFGISEQEYIKISELKSGEIIDREYLIKIFGTQSSLGYCSESEDEIIKNERKHLPFYPNPANIIQKIHNPIDTETLEMIQKMYELVNIHLTQQQNTSQDKMEYIRILKTFAFGIYIFIGFLLTYCLGNKIFQVGLEFFLKILKNIYQ